MLLKHVKYVLSFSFLFLHTAFPHHERRPTTIANYAGNEYLNSVIPRPSPYPFAVEHIPEQWRAYYPHLAQPSTMAAINEIFPAVGYLFALEQNQCIALGTAFQLAPTIISTSLHVVEGIKSKMPGVKLFYTSLQHELTGIILVSHSTSVKLITKLTSTRITFLHTHGHAVEVNDIFEEDPLGYGPAVDPIVTKKEVFHCPDFCLLSLQTPQVLTKYFVPHMRACIQRCTF
jgi:hypothetical protein